MRWRVFTAQYGLSPYVKQIHFIFKGLICFSAIICVCVCVCVYIVCILKAKM